MLTLLRGDHLNESGRMAVLLNDYDAIDEQEEWARAEVRLTGALFAYPTAEAFCGMTGYSPPMHPYRTPKGERVTAHRGDVSQGDQHFKKTVPIPAATEAAEAKRGREAKAAEDEHRRERLYNDRKKAKYEAKRRAKVRRWMQESALEEPRPSLRPATIPLPVYCGDEPTELPIYRKGDYASHKVGEGDEFTVLWPGHPINRRVFVCKECSDLMFHGGMMKEAIVFDMDGREMRIEADACWDTFVFHILGVSKP